MENINYNVNNYPVLKVILNVCKIVAYFKTSYIFYKNLHNISEK